MAFISSSTKPSAPLLKITTLTGNLSCTSEMKSPISMVKPPSPESEMTWRALSIDCAPIACGMALAMDPWASEPSMRRRPFIVR